MTLNAYSNRFRPVKLSNCVMSYGMARTFWRHCSQSWVYSDKTTWCLQWETPLKNPWTRHYWDSGFKMSADASALKNLCLWWEFQSHLLFIISPLLKNLFDSPGYIKTMHDYNQARIKTVSSQLPLTTLVDPLYQLLQLLYVSSAGGQDLSSLA